MSKLAIAELRAQIADLQRAVHGHVRRRLTKRQLAELEGMSTRHVMRGVKAGTYAQPEVENGRLYWWSDTYRLKSATADTAEARAARNPQLRGRQPEA